MCSEAMTAQVLAILYKLYTQGMMLVIATAPVWKRRSQFELKRKEPLRPDRIPKSSEKRTENSYERHTSSVAAV